MWILFSFATAFCETAKDIIGKTTANKTNEYVTAFSLQFFAAVILLPTAYLVGLPPLKPGYFIAVGVSAFVLPLATILYVRAVKVSPLSVSVPMLSVNPIFTALLALVFDRRVPNIFGWGGIVLVSVGLYVSRLSKEVLKKGIFFPFLSIREEPGALAMLAVGFIWAAGTYLSKFAILNSSPLATAAGWTATSSVVLFVIARRKARMTIQTIQEHFGYLASLGILNALSEFSLFSAIATGFIPYVIPIKRTNIVWSSLAGKMLFGENVGKMKVLGLGLVIIGILFIVAL